MHIATLLALCMLLPALPAAAQVAPAQDPRMAQADRCMSLSRANPPQALALAEDLQGDPALPLEARIMAAACQARAEQLLLRGADSQQSQDRLLALATAPGTPPPLQRKAWIHAVDLMMPTVRGQQTMATLDRLMEQSRQLHDAGIAVFLLHSMARLHVSQMDNPAAALPLLDEAIALSRGAATTPVRREMQLHYNRGYALLRLERHTEAEAAFALTDRMARQLGQQHFLGPRVDSARGEIHRAGGDLAGARTLLEDADARQRRNHDLRGRTSTVLRLAQLALDEGDLHVARRQAGEALDMAEAGRFRSETLDALAMMEAVQAALGDEEAAHRHRDRWQALDASLDRGAALATLTRMRARINRDLGPGAVLAAQLGAAQAGRDVAQVALAIASALLAGALSLLFLRRRRAAR